MSQQDTEETLDPPKFRLPDNFHPERFEVWTLRLPRDFDLADLDGARFPLSNEDAVDFASKRGNQKFTLQWGDARESECFRMILPRPDDNNEDSDDDDDGTFLYPADIPFVRHATILPAIEQKTQFQLAPSIENAPPAQNVRHSYAPVPQKQGLKRRWTPLGGNTTVVTSLPLKRKRKTEVKQNTTSSGRLNHQQHPVIKRETEALLTPPTASTNQIKDDPDMPTPDRKKSTKKEAKENGHTERVIKSEAAEDDDSPITPSNPVKDDPDTLPSDRKNKVKKEKKSEKKDKKKKRKSES